MVCSSNGRPLPNGGVYRFRRASGLVVSDEYRVGDDNDDDDHNVDTEDNGKDDWLHDDRGCHWQLHHLGQSRTHQGADRGEFKIKSVGAMFVVVHAGLIKAKAAAVV